MPRGTRRVLAEVGTPGPTTTKTDIPAGEKGKEALAYLEKYRFALGDLERQVEIMGQGMQILGMKVRAERILAEIREAQNHADVAIVNMLDQMITWQNEDTAKLDGEG